MLITFFMSIGTLLFTSGCQRDQHVGEYEFNYYPDRNIYYNVEASKFIYSIDGGKTWENFSPGSRVDQSLLGKSEKVYSKTQEVWKENEAHLKMYEGKIYTLVNEQDKNVAPGTEEVSDKRLASSGGGGAARKSGAAPKKKGLKGFFNRVFGKKDKK